MTKKKILVLSDHPLSPSGVGTQTRYMIEALLKTGKYEFVCLGGAMKHQDYTPKQVEGWGKDWRIFPVDGYGTPEIIRSLLQKEKPDLLWFMTDPRFYGWLWEMENEVRANVPMVYYHVWDNYPAPVFNGIFYRSTDEVVCISKLTYDVVREVSPEVFSHHIPHAVNSEFFYKYKTQEERERIDIIKNRLVVESSVNYKNPNKKIFFWNNRNARRKQSGTLIWWFKQYLDDVGHDKAMLLMHTDARDQHLGVDDGQVMLSTNKVPPSDLANIYNTADFTINISDAEGFGLATLESLACGTPIIVNMTGGLQEQVTNGTDWFGWGIQPASRAVIGSLQVPYIYEDRISREDFHNTLKKALNVSNKSYKKMSLQGLNHVANNYSFEQFNKNWVEAIDKIIERQGSWKTRKDYKRWHLLEVA